MFSAFGIEVGDQRNNSGCDGHLRDIHSPAITKHNIATVFQFLWFR